MSVTETTAKGRVGASETRHAKKVKKLTKTVVVGKIKVTLAAGQKKTVELALNAAGKRLLRSRRTLAVKLATDHPEHDHLDHETEIYGKDIPSETSREWADACLSRQALASDHVAGRRRP